MGIPPVRRRRTARAGFTLIELVLVVALLLLLAGAAALNFDSLQRGSALDEGVGQMESLFRYARAQAEVTGRQVRVVFGPLASLSGAETPTGTNAPSASPGSAESAPVVAPSSTPGAEPTPELQLVWEPDPVRAPGRYVALPEASGFVGRLNELIRYRRVADPWMSTNALAEGVVAAPAGDSLSGTNGMPAAVAGSGENDPLALPPIAFFPDGSSDNAELEVYSLDPADARVFRLSLTGITGTCRRRLVPPPGSEWLETETSGMESSAGPAAAGTAPNP